MDELRDREKVNRFPKLGVNSDEMTAVWVENDLAGGSAGFTGEAVAHIRQNSQEVVQSLALLISTDEEFSTAMDVNRRASTPLDRQIAAVSTNLHIPLQSNI